MERSHLFRSHPPTVAAGGGRRLFQRGGWFLPLALAVLTFLVYAPVARHEFVNYDDADYLTENRQVQDGLTARGVVWAFTTGHASNWHPLTWFSHMLDWQLFGDRPGAHHLVSAALHALNGWLLFAALRALTGAYWRSLLVAGIFALHPLHVESVAWASERKDVLSALFFLLTLRAYASYARRRDRNTPGWGRAYGLVLLAYALGLLSKPMLVTTPFVLLLLDVWPLRRLSFGDGQDLERGTPGQKTARRDEAPPAAPAAMARRCGLEKLPLLGLSAASCVVTFLAQRRGGAVSTALTPGERAANALVAYARYLGKTFWPADLAVLYPHPGQWPAAAVLAAGALVLALSALAVWQLRRRPCLAVGWFWFGGMLIPVIGLVQVGVQSMADRYMYLPLTGLAVALVWGGGEVLRGRGGWARFPLAGGALLGCALATTHQLAFWRNSETLFRRAVAVTRGNYLAWNNLGFYLSRHDRGEEARRCYERSLAIHPAYVDALNNYGYALAAQKRFAEAAPFYERALQAQPGHLEVHNNLGNALSELGRTPEAIEHYRLVLRAKPDHADARNNLGIALAMRGQLDEAIEHFQAALKHRPGYASAHSNLGNAYAAQRKFDAAIAEFEEALRLNPADAQAHNNLANALAEQNRVEEAVRHYEAALHLNADNPEANYNLGLALLRLGKKAAAMARFREAIRLRPGYVEALKQLASQ